MKDRFKIKVLFGYCLLLFFSPMVSKAQDNTSLGRITVYEFRFDSLWGTDGKKYLYAIGTGHAAELYVSNVANNVFFKIKINGEFYAVITNPYGKRVSSMDYEQAGFFSANNRWERLNNLTHKAGSYFLSLPETGQSSTTQKTDQQTTYTIVKAKTEQQQLQWRMMGKVDVVSEITIVNYGEDVHYDRETAFLYSAFDGKQEKYKLSIPSTGKDYEVERNGSYRGARIEWSPNGKYVWSIPSLSEMYTHHAGYYYFNLGDVKM